MPGTQPWGTHAFDPGSQSESSQSATQALDAINAEDDRAEDQVGPPLDSLMADIPAAPDYILASSFASPGPSSAFGSTRPPASSSLLPTVHPLHDFTSNATPLWAQAAQHILSPLVLVVSVILEAENTSTMQAVYGL